MNDTTFNDFLTRFDENSNNTRRAIDLIHRIVDDGKTLIEQFTSGLQHLITDDSYVRFFIFIFNMIIFLLLIWIFVITKSYTLYNWCVENRTFKKIINDQRKKAKIFEKNSIKLSDHNRGVIDI